MYGVTVQYYVNGNINDKVQFYRRSPNPGMHNRLVPIDSSYDYEYQTWKTTRMEEEFDINRFNFIISCSINGHFLPVTRGTEELNTQSNRIRSKQVIESVAKVVFQEELEDKQKALDDAKAAYLILIDDKSVSNTKKMKAKIKLSGLESKHCHR